MTRKIEDFLNIPSIDTQDVDDTPFVDTSLPVIHDHGRELSIREKIDAALPIISDLSSHDREMDDIARNALDSFNELMTLGSNVSDNAAGKIYEVASAMLKTAMDARNSKADRKLKVIELQLKKAKLDLLNGTGEDTDGTLTGEFDRNELRKLIVGSGNTEGPVKEQ